MPTVSWWTTCGQTEDGEPCAGVPFGRTGRCLRHLSPETRARLLGRWQPGKSVDLRGTVLTAELLAELTEVLTDPATGRVRLVQGNFQLARLASGAMFAGGQFDGLMLFGGATFADAADFRDACFGADADFGGVCFDGGVDFGGARFGADANFRGAVIHGNAGFGATAFTERVRFTRTQFGGRTSFREAEFHGQAQFTDARFRADADFQRAGFADVVSFSGVYSTGNVDFTGARFVDRAGFADTVVDGKAVFSEARFAAETTFAGAQVHGVSQFVRTRFDQQVRFTRARLGGARFSAAEFCGEVELEQARFHGDVRFRDARFAAARLLGPVTVDGDLVLDNAVFEQSITLRVTANGLSCRDARFDGEADLRVVDAEVTLDGATSATLTTVAADAGAGHPRLVSLRGVDASRLVLTDVDLSECQFAEARQLDKIRVEGYCPFPSTPFRGRWRWGWVTGKRWPGVWRWTSRSTLAEEHVWRATTAKASGWRPRQGASPLEPERLAVLYRELRRAQESRGNEPGAADFYYGEMEMRRHARVTPFAERLILHGYWAVSGYGLRATRSLVTLLLLTAITASLIEHYGFTAPVHPGYLDTLLYSARATLSLDVHASNLPDTLTRWGQVLRIVLRIAGPLCLALAALAIRGRVKR